MPPEEPIKTKKRKRSEFQHEQGDEDDGDSAGKHDRVAEQLKQQAEAQAKQRANKKRTPAALK